MNLDQLLSDLLPLFQKKIEFTMQMQEKALDAKTALENKKLDTEIRKIESQLSTDKDKLEWEKEKLATAIKGNYDLETLKNSGMLNLERLKQIGEKEKQQIMTESEKYKADMSALGTILGHARETIDTSDGKNIVTRPAADVGVASKSLMERRGIIAPPPPLDKRNVAGEAEAAARVLMEHEKAGTPDAARAYLNALDPAIREETLKRVNPGGTTAVPAAKAPVAPPVAPAPEPNPPVVQTVAPPPAVPAAPLTYRLGERLRSAVDQYKQYQENYQAEQAQLRTEQDERNAEIGRKFLAVPEAIAQGAANFKAGLVRQPLSSQVVEQRRAPDEEERRRTLRRARGLNVDGYVF